MNGYLLLATVCDGTLATAAQFVSISIRVVRKNTLAIALSNGIDTVKVFHRSQFDAAAVKRQLGIAVSTWLATKGAIHSRLFVRRNGHQKTLSKRP